MKEFTGCIIVDRETGEILENAVALTEERKAELAKPASKVRGSMREITCAAPGCSKTKMVRLADIKRGWGKYCSKACAKK